MAKFLAIRDHDTMKVVEVRELNQPELDGFDAFYEQTARKYPQPRWDVTIGVADDAEAFLTAYPRYRPDGAGGKAA